MSVVLLPAVCMEAVAAGNAADSLIVLELTLAYGARIGVLKYDRWWRCFGGRCRRRLWQNVYERTRRRCAKEWRVAGDVGSSRSTSIPATGSLPFSDFLPQTYRFCQCTDWIGRGGKRRRRLTSLSLAVGDVAENAG